MEKGVKLSVCCLFKYIFKLTFTVESHEAVTRIPSFQHKHETKKQIQDHTFSSSLTKKIISVKEEKEVWIPSLT